MFSFFKKRKPEGEVPMPDIQNQPEPPEKKEPVRTEYKNGCFTVKEGDEVTLFSKDGKVLLRDTCGGHVFGRYVFEDAFDGEFVSVHSSGYGGWSLNYDLYNADGLRIHTDGSPITDEETLGQNLIMFPGYRRLSIYSKVLKRFVSVDDGKYGFWFDGVIGLRDEDGKLTDIKAVSDEVETDGYGTLMIRKKYRVTYVIDLDGNIIKVTKKEIKEEENEEK